MASDEFDIIRRCFNTAALAFPRPRVSLGIGDDCALIRPAPGMEIAMSMDLLQEHIHFLADADPFLLGKRSLLVNLSDLAAMGATPLCFTLGLALPDADEAWLAAFSRGLAEVAQAHQCTLVGGDMSAASPQGGKTICIQVQGEIPQGAALRRDRAQVGDLIFVTGTLGDAAAGLKQLQGEPGALNEQDRRSLVEAFYEPESRVAAGQLLQKFATACIDLSDGLASDLRHILRASAVGAEIDLRSLPLSDAFRAAVPEQQWSEVAVSGGDDYELCFTVPRTQESAMRATLEAQVPITCIGQVTAREGLVWMRDGGVLDTHWQGYRHFESTGSVAEGAT